ncbi:hypothetical protein AB4Z46_14210 [Variovorax sp. M-6]|uniref:hypothetical protein n=1 Tax=Variovorax sp. M-6 TaxID=3233041 RepID=UPI003F99AF17
MNDANPYWAILEAAFSDTSEIIVPEGTDEAAYFERLRSRIREHATCAELVSASVRKPGFPHRGLGSTVFGYTVARSNLDGYWLVFQPDEGRFYCFSGTDRDNLGAFGVCGSPLYCWWA